MSPKTKDEEAGNIFRPTNERPMNIDLGMTVRLTPPHSTHTSIAYSAPNYNAASITFKVKKQIA